MKSYIDKLFILEGIILAIIGIMFFINPLESLLTFTTISGILIIIYAISRIVRSWKFENKFLSLTIGIIDILFGVILILYPLTTIENMILFFGIWALIRGIVNIVLSFSTHSFGLNFFTFYNIISVILGLLIAFYPYITFFALAYVPYVIGGYFIFVAICEIYVGYKI